MRLITIGQDVQYLQTRVTFHYTSNGHTLFTFLKPFRLQVHVFMFMNKISMSQTCLYNISYKKKPFLQRPVATEDIQL